MRDGIRTGGRASREDGGERKRSLGRRKVLKVRGETRGTARRSSTTLDERGGEVVGAGGEEEKQFG